MVTKEEYNAAKLVVQEYESQLQRELDRRVRRIKQELIGFFKDNLVSGRQIKKFDIRVSKNFVGEPLASIVFIDPYFDEDYWDKSADKYFEELGKKYQINLHPESGIYPK